MNGMISDTLLFDMIHEAELQKEAQIRIGNNIGIAYAQASAKIEVLEKILTLMEPVDGVLEGYKTIEHPGAIIKKMITRTGLVLKEFCEKHNIPYHLMIALTSETNLLTASTAISIAKGLGIKPQVLLIYNMYYELREARAINAENNREKLKEERVEKARKKEEKKNNEHDKHTKKQQSTSGVEGEDKSEAQIGATRFWKSPHLGGKGGKKN